MKSGLRCNPLFVFLHLHEKKIMPELILGYILGDY